MTQESNPPVCETACDPNTLKMPQPTLIDAMKMDLHKTRQRAGLLQDAIELLEENPCIQEFIELTNKMRQQ